MLSPDTLGTRANFYLVETNPVGLLKVSLRFYAISQYLSGHAIIFAKNSKMISFE